MSKTCTTCGQVLPAEAVKSGDIVNVRARSKYDYSGLAIVQRVSGCVADVTMITGDHKGVRSTAVYVTRLTVVHGSIHIDGLQMQGQSHVGPSVFDHKI